MFVTLFLPINVKCQISQPLLVASCGMWHKSMLQSMTRLRLHSTQVSDHKETAHSLRVATALDLLCDCVCHCVCVYFSLSLCLYLSPGVAVSGNWQRRHLRNAFHFHYDAVAFLPLKMATLLQLVAMPNAAVFPSRK